MEVGPVKALVAFGLAYLLICGIGCATKLHTETHPDWILGSWRKTFDPANDPEETITFQKDGSFIGTVVGNTDSIKGEYEVLEPVHVVLLKTVENQKVTPMAELKFEDTRDKLYYAGKSGSPSYYEKVK
jgi:hypothetical protein